MPSMSMAAKEVEVVGPCWSSNEERNSNDNDDGREGVVIHSTTINYFDRLPDELVSLIILKLPYVGSQNGCSMDDLLKISKISKRFSKCAIPLWVYVFCKLDFDLNGDRNHFILNKNMFSAANFQHVMAIIIGRVQCITSLHVDNDKSNTLQEEGTNDNFVLMNHLFQFMATNRQSFNLRDVHVRWSVDAAYPLLVAGLLMLDGSSINSLHIDSTTCTMSMLGPYIRACLISRNLRQLTLKSSPANNNNDLFTKYMVDVLKGPIDVKMPNDCYFKNANEDPESQMTSFLGNVFNNDNCSGIRNILFDSLSFWQPGNHNIQSYRRALHDYCNHNGVTVTSNPTDEYVLTKNKDVLKIRRINVWVEAV